MGNLIATIGTVFVPLIVSEFIVPFIYHPYRWGNTPWSPPSFMAIRLWQYGLTLLFLITLSVISGFMTTLAECKKTDFRQTVHRSLWLILGFLIGNAILFFNPLIKVPLITSLMFLPYAGYIAHGILVALPVFIMGAIGNQVLRDDVC